MQICCRLWDGTYLVELITKKTDIGSQTTYQFWSEEKCRQHFKKFSPGAIPKMLRPHLSTSSSKFIAH